MPAIATQTLEVAMFWQASAGQPPVGEVISIEVFPADVENGQPVPQHLRVSYKKTPAYAPTWADIGGFLALFDLMRDLPEVFAQNHQHSAAVVDGRQVFTIYSGAA